jgi:hypothetical protein
MREHRSQVLPVASPERRDFGVSAAQRTLGTLAQGGARGGFAWRLVDRPQLRPRSSRRGGCACGWLQIFRKGSDSKSFSLLHDCSRRGPSNWMRDIRPTLGGSNAKLLRMLVQT